MLKSLFNGQREGCLADELEGNLTLRYNGRVDQGTSVNYFNTFMPIMPLLCRLCRYYYADYAVIMPIMPLFLGAFPEHNRSIITNFRSIIGEA